MEKYALKWRREREGAWCALWRVREVVVEDGLGVERRETEVTGGGRGRLGGRKVKKEGSEEMGRIEKWGWERKGGSQV